MVFSFILDIVNRSCWDQETVFATLDSMGKNLQASEENSLIPLKSTIFTIFVKLSVLKRLTITLVILTLEF